MRYAKLEAALLRKLGARRYAASGAVGFGVEDGTDGIFMIQLKVTNKDRYELRRETVEKVCRSAALHRKVPLIAIYLAQKERWLLLYPERCGGGGYHNVKGAAPLSLNKSLTIGPTHANLLLKVKNSKIPPLRISFLSNQEISSFMETLRNNFK